MNKLEKYRKEIDVIDNQIIKLFELRMDVVQLISKYKKSKKIKTVDLNREKKMFKANLTKFSNNKYKKYYHHIFNAFLKASKQMQKNK